MTSSPQAADLRVGASLPPLKIEPISRTTLALFAGASGDHNPVHLDIDVARSVGMDDVFAHGMLSMAYLGRLVTGWVPQRRLRSLSVRFKAITPVGAEPVCTGRVASLDEVHGTAAIDIQVALSDGTVTLAGQAVVDIAPEQI